jgi:hypothetical protein
MRSTGAVDDQRSRREILRKLVTLESPRAELAGFAWDSEELVSLTRADALRVLRRYVDGTLSLVAVTRWAEAIEVRDDIGREAGFEQPLNDFLFELANPELDGPLAPERWMKTLTG